MRSAALLLGALLLCVGPLVGRAAEVPATPDPADLPGTYECQGTGADGRPYRGAVIIEPDGSRFLVRWIIASELTAVGVGIREGNMLAVSFFGPESGGIVLYRIDGQQLIGHWSAPLAQGQVFEETLTRVASPPEPPSTTPQPAPRPRPSDTRPFGSSRPI
ncbi:MAG TPA: hypothetical protein VFB99_15610 [Vicinamibacterales bacterium]|jgi:hypothetical protein|nr:hypothetical protein [Vicinamibacterales bacterium]